MLIEKSFRLDDAIPLPADTEILLHKDISATVPVGCCGGTDACSGCSGPKTKNIDHTVKSRFLAVSPAVASYVALDLDLLESFSDLMRGQTLRRVRDDLRQRFGAAEADKKLQLLMRNLVGRNFFADAVREEFVLKHPTMQLGHSNFWIV